MSRLLSQSYGQTQDEGEDQQGDDDADYDEYLLLQYTTDDNLLTRNSRNVRILFTSIFMVKDKMFRSILQFMYVNYTFVVISGFYHHFYIISNKQIKNNVYNRCPTAHDARDVF